MKETQQRSKVDAKRELKINALQAVSDKLFDNVLKYFLWFLTWSILNFHHSVHILVFSNQYDP